MGKRVPIVCKGGIKYKKSGELWRFKKTLQNKNMFRGINTVSMDEKGRLAVPTRYREPLGNEVVLTIDTEERCLLLYPREEWLRVEAKLQELPSFNETTRRLQRLLIGHASDEKVDKSGRILVPALLRDYALFEKEVFMVGQSNKFEVWSEELWRKKREEWLQEPALTRPLPDEMKSFYL